jgi:hypothetical protein
MTTHIKCNECKDTGWIHVPDGLGCISKDLCDCGIYMKEKQDANKRSVGKSRAKN